MIVTAADTAAVAAASDIVNVDAVYDADNNAITAWTRRVQATMPEFILSAAHTYCHLYIPVISPISVTFLCELYLCMSILFTFALFFCTNVTGIRKY